MLFLKCLKKIIVFPVVVMIGFLWLITKILVSLYGVAHREYLMEIRINNSYNVKKKQEILNTLWGRKDEK